MLYKPGMCICLFGLYLKFSFANLSKNNLAQQLNLENSLLSLGASIKDKIIAAESPLLIYVAVKNSFRWFSNVEHPNHRVVCCFFSNLVNYIRKYSWTYVWSNLNSYCKDYIFCVKSSQNNKFALNCVLLILL